MKRMDSDEAGRILKSRVDSRRKRDSVVAMGIAAGLGLLLCVAVFLLLFL